MSSSAAAAGVEVWGVRLEQIDDERLARYRTWLAPEEREKVARFATALLQKEYVVTRALCRWALAHHVAGVDPSALRFERTAEGRPFVVGPAPAPDFNLSNAEGLVVCAVSKRAVGVDVEPVARGHELLATAAKIFSRQENTELALQPAALRSRRAVELWTLKEAYLKARGHGINVHLDRLTIAEVKPSRWAIEHAGVLDGDPARWHLESSEQGDGGYVVSVAAERGHDSDVPIVWLPPAPPG